MMNLLSFLNLSEDELAIILAILLGLIVIGGYIAICACVGKYAKNRGRSFWLFFIIALILNPVIGFIIAALAGESNSFREERIRREVQIRMEEEQRYRQQFNQTPPLRE